MFTVDGLQFTVRSYSRKSPMWTLMPGAPKRWAFSWIIASHSGRISKASICKWGNCRRASIDTLPVQKPMSQKTFFLGSSKAWSVSRRIGIFVIIFSRPSNKVNSLSGMPKGAQSESLAACSRMRQLGIENSLFAASSRVRVVTFSSEGLPKCSPTCMV